MRSEKHRILIDAFRRELMLEECGEDRRRAESSTKAGEPLSVRRSGVAAAPLCRARRVHQAPHKLGGGDHLIDLLLGDRNREAAVRGGIA
jgi:hypothetical protein